MSQGKSTAFPQLQMLLGIQVSPSEKAILHRSRQQETLTRVSREHPHVTATTWTKEGIPSHMAFLPDSSQYGSSVPFGAVYPEEAVISDSSNE